MQTVFKFFIKSNQYCVSILKRGFLHSLLLLLLLIFLFFYCIFFVCLNMGMAVFLDSQRRKTIYRSTVPSSSSDYPNCCCTLQCCSPGTCPAAQISVALHCPCCWSACYFRSWDCCAVQGIHCFYPIHQKIQYSLGFFQSCCPTVLTVLLCWTLIS